METGDQFFDRPILKSPYEYPARHRELDEEAARVATDDQQYELAQTINSVRNEVDRWRALPDLAQWRLTPETARLLQHWRHHRFNLPPPRYTGKA